MIRTLRKLPAWIWLIIGAFALRIINAGQESLWYDESFTAWVAKLNLGNLWTAVQGDVHPPLWYAIEWINVHLFGSSEFVLRLPSVLFGTLAVYLVYRLAIAVRFEPRTALAAGVIAAVLPGALYYSQEARMYSMLCCFVLLIVIAAIQHRWILFSVACIGTVYSQNLGVLYVAAIGSIVLIERLNTARYWSAANGWECARSLILKPIAALAVVVVAWLPWAAVMIGQMRAMSGGFWLQALTPGGALVPLAQMTMGWRVPDAVELHVYGFAFGITVVGLITSRKWLLSRRGLIVLAATFGMPALAALVSVFWRSIYLPRSMMPAAMALCIIWAYPLMHLSIPNRRVARLLAVPVFAVGLVAHYFPSLPRADVRDWVSMIRTDWQPGDVIYYTAVSPSILAGYYLQGLPYLLRPAASDLNQSLTESTKAAMRFTQGDLLNAKSYRRAWLVVSINPMSRRDESDEISHVLATHYASIINQFKKNEYETEQIWLVDLASWL